MSYVAMPDDLATGAPEETAPIAPGRVSSGMRWLDVILRGGLPANRVYLVLGEPGTGKTTLSLQFLLAGAMQGETVLLVTLAETRAELEAVAESHGLDISPIQVHEVSTSDAGLEAGSDPVDAGEADLPERDFTALHPEEVELGESLRKIVDVVRRTKPKRVVVDSLTEIRLLAREPVRYRRQILALKNFFMKCGCTVFFIDDPSSRGGAESQLQTICHGVMQLERLAPEYGRERRRMQVLKMRGVQFHGGYHDYVIRPGGLVIWPRLVASHHRRQYELVPVPSGVAQIDQLMGGGPDRGTTMLALGPAGVGKSSLCQQYCMAAAGRGEYFAWFSFDERLETIFKRGTSMKFDLRGLAEAGKCSIEQVDPGSLSPGEFIQRVRRQVEKFDARVVVIDSLNGYMNSMPGERFLTIQMHELLTYLNQMGVLTIIVIAQHGLLGAQIDPPIDLSYLSDSVVVLRYFEAAGHVRRAMAAVKKRGGAHETSVREFQVTETGLRLGEPLEQFQGILTGQPELLDREYGRGGGGGGGGGGMPRGGPLMRAGGGPESAPSPGDDGRASQSS